MNKASSEGIKLEYINEHNMNIHKSTKNCIVNIKDVAISQSTNQ